MYRAVDARITNRLQKLMFKLSLVDRDQVGFVKEGNTLIAIDIFKLMIEDSILNRREAWLCLLDCSEAFDSLDDAVTDIAFSCAGLPQRFIRWALRARQLQQRVIITAGGISPLTKSFLVKGGSQGAPSMPAYWAIASNIMIRFTKKFGGEGYTISRNGIPTINLQQAAFADDNLAMAAHREKLIKTVQSTFVVQAVMNIRSQASKSTIILTQPTLHKLNEVIKAWRRDETKLQVPNLEKSTSKSYTGRSWPDTLPENEVPLTHPAEISYSPDTSITLTRKIKKGYLTALGLSKSAPSWGITINGEKEPTITHLDFIRASSALSHSNRTDEQGRNIFQIGDVIKRIDPGHPRHITPIEQLQEDPAEELTFIISRKVLPWKVTSDTHPERYVDEHEARVLIAAHDLTTIDVITLNTSGHVAKSKITVLLPDSRTNDKGDETIINDTTKYLGLVHGVKQGETPHYQSVLSRLYTKSILASELSTSIRTLRTLANSVLGFVNHSLSNTTSNIKELENMRVVMARAAFNTIGLSCPSNKADRLTMLAVSCPHITLGMGMPDLRPLETYQAYRNIQKWRSHRTSPRRWPY